MGSAQPVNDLSSALDRGRTWIGNMQPVNDAKGFLKNNLPRPIDTWTKFNPLQWTQDRFKKPTDPMKGLLEQQQKQAEDAKTQLALKPKQISPDNFLATKSSQLARLRLGLGSTMTAGGGVPPATLSAPALTGSAPGKTKLGQ